MTVPVWCFKRPLQPILLPSMTVCPLFESAYKEEQLRQHGIESLRVIFFNHSFCSQNKTCGANNLLQDYRKGNFKGTSNDDERDIFENVTFSIVDLVKNVTIRFPMKRNNKMGERRKKTVQPQDIKSREIKYLNMGKCFEIQLDQFNEPLGYIEFYFKKSGYIYVNSEGQFHNRDSFSKVGV